MKLFRQCVLWAAFLIIGLAMTNPVCGEEAVRSVIGHARTGNTLALRLTDGVASLTMHTPRALEFVFAPAQGASNPPSHAIHVLPQAFTAEIEESDNRIVFRSQGIRAEIDKSPFRIRYWLGGRELLGDKCDPMGDSKEVSFRFDVGDDDVLYGCGSRVLGKMNRRGERLPLYNSASYAYADEARQMYYSMPTVVSSRKYMLVFDNGARGSVDLDSRGDGTLQFDAVGGRRAYVLIAGDSWPDLSMQIARTTGSQPMLPRWAMGNITSRMGYHSRAEVESVIDGYRKARIPVDAIVLDLFWFGPSIFGTMGNLDWDLQAFPEPVEMMDKLRADGVQTILITEPLVLTASRNWEQAVEARALATDNQGRPYVFSSFFGDAALVDVFKPEAREWFWSHYKRHTSTGVAGWWGDLGEPETHPDDIRHANGRGEDVHNLFGHSWAGLVYEGMRRDFPEQRPFILMRSGFVGTQRYGILPWSGDVSRSWGGFRSQVELSLQMGLQGVGYMHSDLGGFAGSTRDAELYVRWMQYGVFQPLYRPHAHEEVPPEPIFWDEETQRIVRRSIDLRYQLLPYNYTLMFENSTKGLPLMRPLMYADGRASMLDRLDAYLWGDSFLVAPITSPGQTEREVPLPEGSSWFEFSTDTKHEGGKIVTVPVTMERIPVFVKGGAFVPMSDTIQTTRDYDPARTDVHFYADPSLPSSSGYLYDDDGKTAGAFEKGQYEIVRFAATNDGNESLTITVAGERNPYPGRPDARELRFIIHGLKSKPSVVHVDGVALDHAAWDETARTLSVPVTWSGKRIEITLKTPAG